MRTDRILKDLMIFLCLAVTMLIVLLVGIMIGAFWLQDFFPTTSAPLSL